MQEEFNPELKQVSIRNSQGNSVLEKINQVMGNMIRTFQVYTKDDMDENDHLSGILLVAMFVIRSTYYTT